MGFPCYTTQSLERLSTDELIKLAETQGLDIPPDLERIFIIEELLYLDRGNIGKTGEEEETYVLSRQREVSTVEVLVRDPLWAFVFWEIKKHDQEMYEGDADFEGYRLRVNPLKEGSLQPDIAGVYTVDVGRNDTARYLGFPPDDRRFFRVELCVPKWENHVVIAVSRAFRLPRLIDAKQKGDEEIQKIYQNPMAQLSGIDHFTMLRNRDRLLRPRGE